MPMPYPTNKSFATVVDLFRFVNRADVVGTEGLFGAIMVLLVFLTAWAAFTRVEEDFIKAVIAASLISSIFAIFLDLIGLVPTVAPALSITIWLLALVADKYQEEV